TKKTNKNRNSSSLSPNSISDLWCVRVCFSPSLLPDKMGQQNLIYSFVARGTVILAEYTEFKGNFTSVAAQCLQKLPSSNNKFTYNCDGHTFNYLVENGFTYCVVAVESAGRQITMAFLERVKEDFNKRYGGGKATTAKPNSLNKEFGSKLKGHMQYCVDHPEEINKLSKVKAQVTEVKGVMMENIEKVLDRGEKIELLVDKTENLRSQVSTRLQNTRNENKKKDVVGEHEDQAHSPRYHHCLDSDHYSLGLSWVQVYLNLETIRRLYYERLSAPYCSTRLMETPHR
uniref:Longin domain-containing protein n=1 Tax=Brassica oleracea var. oleracea TaxID=109376 RepID=A0A0D3BSQ7_BRAOL